MLSVQKLHKDFESHFFIYISYISFDPDIPYTKKNIRNFIRQFTYHITIEIT
jgi:hypothetical protein